MTLINSIMLKSISLLLIVNIIIFLSHSQYASCNDQPPKTNSNNNNNDANIDDDDDNADSNPPATSQTFDQSFRGSNSIVTSTQMPVVNQIAADSAQETSTLMHERPHQNRSNKTRSRHRTRTRMQYHLYASNNESTRSQSYCIQRPTKFQFCNSVLDFGHFMRLPNFIGHKNELELVHQTYFMMQNLSKLHCEGISQLKLVLCSLLSPSCLDANVLPCRQSCLLAKTTCRAPMQRMGIEWPTFLDCRRLPASQDNCVSRTLTLVNASFDLTTIESTTPQAIPVSSSKRRRKLKKIKALNSSTTTTTTTTLPTLSNDITSTSTTIAPDLSSELNSLASSVNQSSSTDSFTPTPKSQATTEIPMPVTSELPSQTSTTTPTNEVPTTQSVDSVTPAPGSATTVGPIAPFFGSDYSSMPINVTEDLTQLLCSTSPDWLIKTKLTDSQLIQAARRRELRVRVFRQVFGPQIATMDHGRNSSQRSLFTRTYNDHSRRNSTYLSLNLSDTTIFISPFGSSLVTQPLNTALLSSRGTPSNNQSTSGASSHKVGRYYLISGTGGHSAGSIKLASVFVFWPNFHRASGSGPTDSDSRASRQIVKTYREFKLNGSKVCDRIQLMTRSGPLNRGETTVAQPTSRRSVRARKSRKELPVV